MRRVWVSNVHLLSEDGTLVNTSKNFTLTPSVAREGYKTHSSRLGGSLHRMLADSFLGGIPPGMVVNHLDGNKQNNHLSNLEITTHQLNTIHAYETGLAKGKKGEENSQAELSEKEVLAIYQMFREGCNNMEVAERYNVHDRYVSLIRHKRRWSHLAPKDETFPKSFTFKYPKELVLKAYDMSVSGVKNMDISKETGIERSMVSRIANGKSYSEFIALHRGCND